VIDSHYAAVIAGVFITALAHMLLKSGAVLSSGRASIRLWLNPWSIAGYSMLLGVTLMNLYGFKVVPIRANVVLSPAVFFFVTLLSVVFLRERLTRVQVAGCALILAGIAVFNL
jgi:drug/metabolite transporter (DMT)-like permease